MKNFIRKPTLKKPTPPATVAAIGKATTKMRFGAPAVKLPVTAGVSDETRAKDALREFHK